jgi:hypothetical protein
MHRENYVRPAGPDAAGVANRLQTRRRTKKNRAQGPVLFSGKPESGSLDVAGLLLAFVAFGDIEGHFLAFLEGFEPVHVDAGEMRKEVFTAAIGRNETITFCIVEPLDGTCCHFESSFRVRSNAGNPATACKSHSPKSNTNTGNHTLTVPLAFKHQKTNTRRVYT